MQYQEQDYPDLTTQGTASSSQRPEGAHVVAFPFERYVVKVRLSSTGQFLGIEEIAVHKDFLGHQQRLASLGSAGSHDVEKLYLEPED